MEVLVIAWSGADSPCLVLFQQIFDWAGRGFVGLQLLVRLVLQGIGGQQCYWGLVSSSTKQLLLLPLKLDRDSLMKKHF